MKQKNNDCSEECPFGREIENGDNRIKEGAVKDSPEEG